MIRVCPRCHTKLTRVFDGGEVLCNRCNESIVDSDYDNETGRRVRGIKCPFSDCGFYPIMNPEYKTKCPKCGRPVLNSSSKEK